MNTRCEKCAFKVIEDNIQTGCKFDIINKILNYNNVYSTKNIILDHNSYILENFYCPYARTQEWVDAIQDNIEDQVVLTTHQKYYMVIIVNDTNIDNCLFILNNIISETLLPYRISISCIQLNKENIEKLQQFCINNISKLNIVWKIHNLLDAESTDSEAVDVALETSLPDEANMICVFNAAFEYKQIYLHNIYDIINMHLYKPVAVVSADQAIHNICIPKNLYMAFHKKIGLVLDYMYNDDTQNQNAIIYYLQ